MLRRIVEWKYSAIGAVLLLALVIRLPQVHFGLPFHLFGDEEANVYGALKMLQLKTLLPVLHENDFGLLLYYPPVLAYIYTVVFVPVVGAMYIFSHGSLHDLINQLTLDPSVFWYIARGLNCIFELGNIYLVYRLGSIFFRDRRPALIAAVFLATSFIEVTVSAAIHHWTPAIFFSLLSIYLVVNAYKDNTLRNKRLLYWSGISAALSFGIGFSVYFLPFLTMLALYLSGCISNPSGLRFRLDRTKIENSVLDMLRIFVPFGIIAAVAIAAHPVPLFTQVIHHTAPEQGTTRTLHGFIFYYAKTLWFEELPLLIAAVTGFLLMAWKRRRLWYGCVIFFATWSFLTYAFLFNISRYLLPALPFAALLAGYGVFELIRLIPSGKTLFRKTAAFTVALAYMLYIVMLYGHLEVLLMRNDTRITAAEWIETAIPAHTTVIVDSERLRFLGTSASTRFQNGIDPQSLRAADRVMLESDAYAHHPFDLSSLFFATRNEKATLIDHALTATTSPKYFVTDSWVPAENTDFIADMEQRGDLIKSFGGGDGTNTWLSLPIGGERDQGDENIIAQLSRINQFGPNVFIYKLRPHPAPVHP